MDYLQLGVRELAKLFRRQKNSEQENVLSIPVIPGHLNQC